MFRRAPNDVEELVERTTSENLTNQDWGLTMELCDRVARADNGPRDCVTALLKRITHKNPNVAKYALLAAEACVKNCGLIFHREVAKKEFLHPLIKHLHDKTTHDLVKTGILSFIEMCAVEFRNDPSLSLVDTEYQNLKRQGFVFPPNTRGQTTSASAAPSKASGATPKEDEDRAKQEEEEELQLALALSMSEAEVRKPSRMSTSSSNLSPSASQSSTSMAPSSTSALGVTSSVHHAPASTVTRPTGSESPRPSAMTTTTLTRVRAEYDFTGTERGELTFRKGDVIEVLDRSHQDWWRGRTGDSSGVFPANYVKPIADEPAPVASSNPTPQTTVPQSPRFSLPELEASIDPVRIQALLELLEGVDPRYQSVADDTTIQTLYSACAAMKPKLAQLVIEYGQRKDDLLRLNDSFLQARASYDKQIAARLKGMPGGKFQQGGYVPPPSASPYPTVHDPSGYNPYMGSGPLSVPAHAYGPPPTTSAPPAPPTTGTATMSANITAYSRAPTTVPGPTTPSSQVPVQTQPGPVNYGAYGSPAMQPNQGLSYAAPGPYAAPTPVMAGNVYYGAQPPATISNAAYQSPAPSQVPDVPQYGVVYAPPSGYSGPSQMPQLQQQPPPGYTTVTTQPPIQVLAPPDQNQNQGYFGTAPPSMPFGTLPKTNAGHESPALIEF